MAGGGQADRWVRRRMRRSARRRMLAFMTIVGEVQKRRFACHARQLHLPSTVEGNFLQRPRKPDHLEHAAQRLIQVALWCDSSISLLPVQIEDRCVRLVIRLTAADLARAATTSNLGLQLDGFRNFAVLKP